MEPTDHNYPIVVRSTAGSRTCRYVDICNQVTTRAESRQYVPRWVMQLTKAAVQRHSSDLSCTNDGGRAKAKGSNPKLARISISILHPGSTPMTGMMSSKSDERIAAGLRSSSGSLSSSHLPFLANHSSPLLASSATPII